MRLNVMSIEGITFVGISEFSPPPLLKKNRNLPAIIHSLTTCSRVIHCLPEAKEVPWLVPILKSAVKLMPSATAVSKMAFRGLVDWYWLPVIVI